MMNKKTVKTETWRDNYKIHSYEVDVNGRATFPALCRFMQESAWNHAEHLEFGFSHLMKYHLVWVLYRQLVKMYAFPLWGQSVTVETWPAARDRLYYFRDFRIWGEKEDLLGEAATSWFVIDIEKRLPQRTDAFFKMKVPDNIERVFAEKPGKLKKVDFAAADALTTVKYSDLDVNGHVNNVKFIDWILDSHEEEFLKTHLLTEFEINYLSEAKCGERVLAAKTPLNDMSFQQALIRENDAEEYCRAKTLWHKIK